MFILESNVCTDYSILATILFIKNLLNIIWIAIPAILILLLTIDIAKAVVAGDENKMEEAKKLAVKRIIYAVILFLVPMIVNATFNLIGESTTGAFTCYSNATDETVEEAYYAHQEAEEARKIEQSKTLKAKEEQEKQAAESDIKKYTDTSTGSSSSKTTQPAATVYNSTSLAQNRVQALKPWEEAMTTQFHWSKGQTYKFVRCGSNPKQIRCPSIEHSKTVGSCITFPMVSLMRLNILPSNTFLWHARPKSGNVNYSKSVNKNSKAYKYIVSHPGYYKLSEYHAKKTMQQLINSGDVEYGDIISAQGHQFVYMGTPSNKYTYYTMGHGNMGKDKKTPRIGDRPRYRKWKVVSVIHIKTHDIKTSCVNGKITKGGMVMASRDATITYSPKSGYKLKSITVDGRNVNIAQHPTHYTFKDVTKDHKIAVVYARK